MIAPLLKRSGLALAFAAVCGTAHAEALLRSNVTVTAPLVTIGDLFDNAGLLSETAIFRAPAPGTTGTVSLADIATAVGAAGLEEFEAYGLTEIKVSRSGMPVDMDLLSNLISADLTQRGILGQAMEMRISLNTPLPELVAADTSAPASLVMLRYMPGSSHFSARFQVSGLDNPVDVSGQIELTIEVPHLTRSLPEGTIIGPDDIEMRMVPLAYAETAGIVSYDAIIGMQLQRQTRAGVMLRPADLAQPQIIGRNENVTVLYQQGALTLTTTGKALNAASLSEPVSVLNTMTNRVLQGTASGDGTVTITSGPQQLAGL
ncbi:flagellar basal body P-ring formation chaperone FlgA [Pelagibacterium luteolum]|uniref:Flagella basal body P-ring formation protein FlgA n=1 Tax=Pelagibacterium luteolum TaxID=440168 RepID=A0A1G7YAF0_9HYPH|nr:flagellar basal body P-ring formation chaperone FlgA [Pelagibacterium luteolum]SDG93458.1 flagella basal body P-ring formation protein FlgA [Pelagibacterium luteolum]